MGALTLYAIKSSLTLALLYLPYALMLRRETFFRFNRAMLLCIVVLSLLLPCLDVHVWDNGLATPFEPQRQAISSVVLPTLIVGSSESAAADVPADHTAVVWSTLLVYIYIIGVLFFVLWKAVGLIRLIRFIPRGCLWTDKQEGATIYCHADKVSPFSWMRSIVIGEDQPQPSLKGRDEIVLAHELAHVRMHHSWDALFLSCVEVLQWFNPCIWMLDASLREVHEYEADDAVLRRGISARDYQLLLIEKAVARTPYPMVNGFRHSLLKNRITMMTKKKSPRWARLKVLYAVPLTLIALGAMASQQMAEKVETPIAKKTQTAEVKRQVKAVPGTLRVVVDGQEMTPQEAMKAVEGKEIRNELTPENELRITTTDKSKEKALPLCVLVDGKPMGDITASDEMRKMEKYVKADEIGSLSVTNNEKVAKEIYKDFDKQKYSGIVIIETKKDNKEVEADDDEVVDVPQICAEFRDSLTNNNIYAWLSQNMRYPKEAQDKNIEGRVSIQFIIEKDGSIDEVKTLRSPSEILSAEAERVVKAMPKWKPAMHKGKPVRMRYVLPVLFKLPTKEQVATVAVDEVKGN